MASYKAPRRDILFALNDVLNVNQLTEIEAYSDATTDIVTGVVDEAARFVEEKIAPLNHAGDEQGCDHNGGDVTVPDGYAEVYDEYWQSGWVSLANDPEFGGQGLPFVLSKVVEEMVCSGCVAYALYPGLTTGVYEALEALGTDEQKQTYLPKIATGEWMGTMCMTESSAGSDIGALRTKAEPQPDGSYKITGSKIFITSGEHPITKNIIHYVLARLPDAPSGVRGLSTFVVPKFMINDDGSLGDRNAVRCTSIEEKMGIHGSCTCSLAFDGATGWMVGKPNQGIQNMFIMMNKARIMVGFQGLGQMELARQAALEYAKERVQGKPMTGGADCAIIEHPDVRRMLLGMKALTEAGRVMAYETGINVDLAKCANTEEERQQAQDWVELTTPLVKGFLTDQAVTSGSEAIQVYGGHGYISEHGIEQILRDSKILCLYEGTNGIQAMDLVRRKLTLHGGRLPQQFFSKVEDLIAQVGNDKKLEFVAGPLAWALGTLTETTTFLQESMRSGPNDAGAGAVPFLRAFTLVMLGYNWLRMVQAVLEQEDDDFRAGKLAAAQFFVERYLPEVGALCQAARAGSDTMMSLSVDAF